MCFMELSLGDGIVTSVNSNNSSDDSQGADAEMADFVNVCLANTNGSMHDSGCEIVAIDGDKRVSDAVCLLDNNNFGNIIDVVKSLTMNVVSMAGDTSKDELHIFVVVGRIIRSNGLFMVVVVVSSVILYIKNGPMHMNSAMIAVQINNDQSPLRPMFTTVRYSTEQQADHAHGQRVEKIKSGFLSKKVGGLVEEESNILVIKLRIQM